eukprot:Selendium_serpulae@DN9016_c0_g1_i1.p1
MVKKKQGEGNEGESDGDGDQIAKLMETIAQTQKDQQAMMAKMTEIVEKQTLNQEKFASGMTTPVAHPLASKSTDVTLVPKSQIPTVTNLRERPTLLEVSDWLN